MRNSQPCHEALLPATVYGRATAPFEFLTRLLIKDLASSGLALDLHYLTVDGAMRRPGDVKREHHKIARVSIWLSPQQS